MTNSYRIGVASINDIIFARNMASIDWHMKMIEFNNAEMELRERMLEFIPEEIRDWLGSHLKAIFEKGHAEFNVTENQNGFGDRTDIREKLNIVMKEWINVVNATCFENPEGVFSVHMVVRVR